MSSTSSSSPAISHMTRPLDAAAALVMIVLCLSWGFNQVAVKLALPDIPPLIQAAIRSTGAALIVFAWALARRIPLFRRDGTLWPGLAAGVLFGVEFILLYRGLLYTTASRAVLFIYTAPFFVVIGARFFLPGDRFALTQWLGLLLSFAGLAVAFGVPTPAADPRELVGDMMIVVAAIAWASTTVIIKGSRLLAAPPEKTLLYQLVVSAVMLGLAIPLFGEHMAGLPSPRALGWLAYQTVWVVAITFLIWFVLITKYSASRMSVFTFLTPLFGVAAGVLLMGDPLTPAFLLAVALVAAGLILVNRPR